MSRRAAVHLAFAVLALVTHAQCARFWDLGLAHAELRGLLRIAGAAAAMVCVATVHYTADALCERSVAWLVAGTWLAACSPFMLWAVADPRTVMAAVLTLAMVLLLHWKRPVLAGVAAGALALARPESALLPLLTCLHGLWLRHRDAETPPWLPRFSASALPLTALALTAIGWRAPAQGSGAIPYFHDALAGYLPVPVLVLSVAALSFRGSEGPLFTVPPVLLAGQIAITLATAGDPWPLYRPFMTLAPLAFLLASAGLETVLGLIGPFLSGLDRGAAVLGIALCALQLHHIPADHAAAVRRLDVREAPQSGSAKP